MKQNIKWQILSVFIFLNFILSVILSFSYVFISDRSFYEFLFLFSAAISNTLIIYIPLILISFLFTLIHRYSTVIIFSVFHILLIIDFVIYKFWDFHINSMVINLIITPGGIESLQQSWNVKAVFLTLVLIILLSEIFMYYITTKIIKKNSIFNLIKKTFYISLVFVFIDKMSFAVASLYDFTTIMKNRELFPLYQPLTIRSFASRYLGFKLEKIHENINLSNTNFNYPKNKIYFDTPAKKYNIVMLVIDSMRYDMLDKDITPNIWDLSKNAYVFKNHYSGGNCTRFGIFSMIYGLYGNYWFNALSNRKGPVLIDVLKKQGYDMRIISSTKLSFPEFNKTCFIDVEREKILDDPVKGNGAVRDIDTTNRAIDFIKKHDRSKPYFMFVFFDASHGSFDYTAEFEKFKPSYGINLLKLKKENILPLFNKYKNSIYFIDWLAGRIINSIKESGDLKNTIIIITGDHGEAFFDRGYTGHNHSYSKEEVSVPLVFYHPDMKPKIITQKTSHMDIPQTILEILRVKNPKTDYSQGKNLFKDNEWKYIPVFSWSDSGIIFEDYTMVVPLSTYGGRLKFYRNSDWKEVEKKHELIVNLVEFKNSLTEFLKK